MHAAVDFHSRMVSDINDTLRLISFSTCSALSQIRPQQVRKNCLRQWDLLSQSIYLHTDSAVYAQPVLNSYHMFSFLAFVFDPASPIASHRVMAREHYRQASGWYSVDGFSGSRVDLFSIRLVKNLWRIQLCQFPYKDIQKCPLSNDPKFYLLYRCRSRMSERSC